MTRVTLTELGLLPARTRRLLSFLAACWHINVAEELQYRGNFVGSLLGTVFWLATALLTVALFFSHTARVGGWSYWDVVILLGVFNALTGVVETVLRPGIGQLAEDVRSGDLDLVLVRPIRCAAVYVYPPPRRMAHSPTSCWASRWPAMD